MTTTPACICRIRVQSADFSVADELAAYQSLALDCGAEVLFQGRVRAGDDAAPLQHLTLEHIATLTEAEMQRIAQQAAQRWALRYVLLIHRVGALSPGDNIVLVLTAAAHRHDAYEANAFLMDYLKTDVPLWKKTTLVDGSAYWNTPRSSDQQARQQWQRAEPND